MNRLSIFPLLLALLAMVTPGQALAFSFNPNYILSDFELHDSFSMDLNQIQHFLGRGFLANYITEDWQGNRKYAADIIWRAAQNNRINPKFLLVLLQKEQSLVEDDSPNDRQLDWATGYAVCDDCSKDDPAIQRWKGFGKQINSAALQFTEGYMADIAESGSTQGKYGPDIAIQIDNETLIPENAATASLYAYTPHIQGNRNFALIWNRWFSIQHPTGTLVQADGEAGIYLIEYGYKRPIHSWSAFLSRFNKDLIVTVPKTSLANYPDGRSIDFPNYSILQDETGSIYLLVDDSLRHIDSMETFRGIGFQEDEIVQIDKSDLANFDIGEALTLESSSPRGNLLKLSTNGAVFFIKDGARHAIIDPAIQAARFPNQVPITVVPAEVEQYKEGAPVTLPDGYLVKSAEDPTVYVISEGKKKPISSGSVFVSYGWDWADIITVDKFALGFHQTGLAISDVADGLNVASN